MRPNVIRSVGIAIALFSAGSAMAASIVQVDLSKPDATVTGSAPPGEGHFVAVTSGDGKGTLTPAGGAPLAKSGTGCATVPKVSECFELPKLVAGQSLKLAFAGARKLEVIVQTTAAPEPEVSNSQVANGKCGASGTTDPDLQQVYRNAINRSTGLDEADRKKLVAACPGNVYAGDDAIIFFAGDGTPLFSPVPQVDEDDSIQIVFFAKQGDLESAQVEKCNAAPALRIGGSISVAAGVIKTADAGKKELSVLAQRCSSDDDLHVKVKAAGQEKSFTIDTLPLYRLTVGVAFIYDNSLTREYRLAAVKGESVPVIVEDEHVVGLSALAVVTLRVLRDDFTRSPWEFMVRGEWGKGLGLLLLNPTIGISLTQPLDHIYIGDTLNLYPGLGAVLGFHVLRTPSLAGGYSPGDRFAGGTEPPVDMRWAEFEWRNFFVGVSVDTALLAKLLAALNR